MSVGELLKKHRKKSNMSIQDVEDRLYITNVSRYENSLAQPTFASVVRMARLYGLNIKALEAAVK